MPFKSSKQRRTCYYLQHLRKTGKTKRGAGWDCAKWDREGKKKK